MNGRPPHEKASSCQDTNTYSAQPTKSTDFSGANNRKRRRRKEIADKPIPKKTICTAIGPMPESFKKIISLDIMNISNNNLSGLMPKSLETLTYLKYLNVS